MKPPRASLLLKIWLSTSVVLTALFLLTGLSLQRRAIEASYQSLEEEAAASFQAYESLWQARSVTLASVANVIASMPNVRDAFRTEHSATIRDAAGEVWSRVSESLQESAFLVVATADGRAVSPLGASAPPQLPTTWRVITAVREKFPKQVSGFEVIAGQLFQIVLTPVYVDASRGQGLISVLVAGFPVDRAMAQRLKDATGGSEFEFVSGDRVLVTTMAQASGEYAKIERQLIDSEGNPVARLRIYRSFDAARQRLRALWWNLILLWAIAVAAGLVLSYWLARRIVRPIATLDRAASEVARGNYEVRVPVASKDELGRLAESFNSMSESLQSARQELIRQERISTIGRLASSIVHDLRNPLAAIYGGAEMMVDTDLSADQVKRVAANIYRSSRRIQEMLQDLLQVTRGKSGEREYCELTGVVAAAVEELEPAAARQRVTISASVPAGLELPLERARIERVFLNLIGNALEVMPGGGEIAIRAYERGGQVLVEVDDTGPGISPEIRDRIFQPFVSFGKRNGLGLGLALARQSVLDHGGDLWVEEPLEGHGARFRMRLPLQSSPVPA